MADASSLGSTLHYRGQEGSACWEGRIVVEATTFTAYVKDTVASRIRDAVTSFEADIQALATTGMATEFVRKLLQSTAAPAPWEIGEALAECALRTDAEREVHWPWNAVRDRRTPRASLPGADLVGFLRNRGSVHLLIGEVKTSADPDTPPNVMTGPRGLPWQLEESATRLDVQHSLLKWLHSRCRAAPFRNLYEAAVGRYLASGGKDLILVGVLLRDTKPDERDVKGRAITLGAKLPPPTRVDVLAWYLPVQISDWPSLLESSPQ